MIKKKTNLSKTTRRKTAPRPRPPKPQKPEKRAPPPAGALWDDDRAFQILVKNSNEIFTFLDSRGKILYRSPAMRTAITAPNGEILQKELFESIWPEDKKETRKTLALLLASPGKTIPFQSRILNEEGKPRWVEGFAANYLEDPAVGAILVNYHDVTDRKEQEIVLRENERSYRELFEHSTLAIFRSSFDGKVI
ncbi:MAG: PAS domain-containing protein, partial [Anaerolineales bacterium]